MPAETLSHGCIGQFELTKNAVGFALFRQRLNDESPIASWLSVRPVFVTFLLQKIENLRAYEITPKRDRTYLASFRQLSQHDDDL